MRIATWNINSVRLRQDMVKRFMAEHSPDVVCLQETKTPDEFFPRAAFADAGFTHQHIHGMKSYNGVAILSRLPLSNLSIERWAGKDDCRHIHATLPDETEVHCLYVPAGGDIPDITLNEKFAHKLQLLDEIRAWWEKQASGNTRKILVGDLNIAPLEHDVWSHKQLLDVVSHTPIEVEKLAQLQQSIGWYDVMRHFVPAHEKLYSWWSYRAGDWETSNRGRRLDHIWVTQPLIASLKSMSVLREARGWGPKPSDHVPVMVEIG
jgi:exodeoxyribonuclease III